jgi:hypothetical protein
MVFVKDREGFLALEEEQASVRGTAMASAINKHREFGAIYLINTL